jgi:hypothetical protein
MARCAVGLVSDGMHQFPQRNRRPQITYGTRKSLEDDNADAILRGSDPVAFRLHQEGMRDVEGRAVSTTQRLLSEKTARMGDKAKPSVPAGGFAV